MLLKDLLKVSSSLELYLYNEPTYGKDDCGLLWNPKMSGEELKKYYGCEVSFVAAYDFHLNVYIYIEEE